MSECILNDVNKKNDVKSKATEEVKAEPEKIDFSKVKIEPLFTFKIDYFPHKQLYYLMYLM